MFMVLDYYGLYRKNRLAMNFTGFTVSEFDDIYKKIEENYDDYERERLYREDRMAVGGGRNFKLPLRERVLMHANTECLWPQNQDFAGFLFIIVFTLPMHRWGFSLMWTRAQSGEVSDISNLL